MHALIHTRRSTLGHNARRRAAVGFSLVEVVLVVSIIAVLAAIAMPRYARAAAGYRAEAAARAVAEHLKLVRARAIAGSRAWTITFRTSDGVVTATPTATSADTSDDLVLRAAAEPWKASLDKADFLGEARFSFDGFGAPSVPGTVDVVAGSIRSTVTIDLLGNAHWSTQR
ncbi:MAG: prepilin-type N-terminal cleavage/methylation domain-containing protein [Phycisphaerae bacterium]|nr:prepilin-type N-terminal cleavage/methylation domain-containing protein [Phycisphaerae bacterium]